MPARVRGRSVTRAAHYDTCAARWSRCDGPKTGGAIVFVVARGRSCIQGPWPSAVTVVALPQPRPNISLLLIEDPSYCAHRRPRESPQLCHAFATASTATRHARGALRWCACRGCSRQLLACAKHTADRRRAQPGNPVMLLAAATLRADLRASGRKDTSAPGRLPPPRPSQP